MRFSTILALVAAPLAVFAQTASPTPSTNPSSAGNPNPFKVPKNGYSGEAGSTLTLDWTPTTSGTVSLYIRDGSASNLEGGDPIATNIPNSGSYTWSIPSTIVRGSDYTVEIRSPQGSNYTPYFVIDSSVTVASTTAASNSTMSATSASGSSTASGSSSSASGSHSSKTSSASKTSGSGSSSTASGAGFQSTSSSATTNGGTIARATAAAGMLGVIALGALAL